ncbi:tripartite tricarboxylate transporter substrate binding protein [Aureimonas sp. AU22]|uniref:Bug family tripartite tricarboxylate transporter substrate binding protein n=1 Tax=Aureimonas sp. AU22 TaxID=1638162 RepID=UPI000780B393|nr:tripartite tricarboxylate transporter substrate binding protein [Aureimonas sp. AU22]
MHRRLLIAAISAAALNVSLPAGAQDFPARPITLIVPWSAGGGSDATARIVAGGLERELGQPVNVVNRTGGNGVVGHQAIASARPDGYTIGLVTAEINMLHRLGLTQLTYEAYRPVGLVNTDPAAIHVGADSPYGTAKDLLEAIRSGQTVRFSGSGQGSIWHLAMAGLLVRADVPGTAAVWVPSQGAAPALQELASSGVDVVVSSLPEAQAMTEAGRVKTIGLMAAERSPKGPDIPTLAESAGVDWTVASSWRGIVLPAGAPDDVAERLGTALKTVYDSAEYQDFMKGRGFGTVWADADGMSAFMKDKETQFAEVMTAAGLVSN